MSFTPDLDAYFARIGYSGPREPTLAVLASIQGLHVRKIPFENLDVLRSRPIDLDPASLERKLVRDRRGGYCFEQNTYLMQVLHALGFETSALGARVRWQLSPQTLTATTHLLLLVEIQNHRYIADVGFGSMSLTAPLELDTEERQSTPLEPRRIVRRNGFYLQQSFVGGDWADVYEFSPTEFSAADIGVANWYTSTHPESRFRLNLTAACVGDNRRHTLFNREYTIRHADGRAEKRDLASAAELLEVLANPFGLEFPPGTRFNAPNLAWPG